MPPSARPRAFATPRDLRRVDEALVLFGEPVEESLDRGALRRAVVSAAIDLAAKRLAAREPCAYQPRCLRAMRTPASSP